MLYEKFFEKKRKTNNNKRKTNKKKEKINTININFNFTKMIKSITKTFIFQQICKLNYFFYSLLYKILKLDLKNFLINFI